MTSRGKDYRRKEKVFIFNIFNDTFLWLSEQMILYFHFALGLANDVASLPLGPAAVHRGEEGKVGLTPPLRNAFSKSLTALIGDPQWNGTHGWPCKAPKLKLGKTKLGETLCNQLFPTRTLGPSHQQRLQLHMRSMSLSGKEATGQVPALCAVLDSK